METREREAREAGPLSTREVVHVLRALLDAIATQPEVPASIMADAWEVLRRYGDGLVMYEAEIARGMAWLDAQRPGWRERLELTRLDMRHASRCILGQGFYPVSGGQSTGYWDAMHLWGYPKMVELGFCLPSGSSESAYGDLTREWRKALGAEGAMTQKGPVLADARDVLRRYGDG